jgi:hypothetical protein
MFETRGRHQDMSYNINLRNVHCVGLRHIAVVGLGAEVTEAGKTAES